MKTGTRILLGLAVIGATIAVVLSVFQAQIAARLMARMVDSRVGRDVTATLPDGLHVVLCGTGSPLPDATRAGPCSLVIAGKHLFVVDIGEGGARNLALMGVPMGRIEGVFLTHFHSDHLDGMGPLMLLRWTGAAAPSPLPMHGPSGVEAIVAGFNGAYLTDNGYRTAHHGPKIAPPSGAGGIAMPFEIGTADSMVIEDADGLKITAFRVDHGPVKPAFGYRFDYKGRSVVFSGDTVPTPTLITAAKGADLLVNEALQPKLVSLITAALEAKGQANTAQITRDIVSYHTTPQQAADTAKAANVHLLVLNHLVPPVPVRFAYRAFLGDAAQHFGGEIIIGEDGMMFSLPAGTTEIRRRKLL